MSNNLLQFQYTLDQIPEFIDTILEQITEYRICLLRGQMGAGKTTLSNALIAELSEVPFKGSPTFALVNEYPLKEALKPLEKLYHFDLYRLEDIEEAWDIGVEEMWSDPNSISIIEWPEKAESILPQKHVSLDIEILSPTLRRITIKK